MSETSPFAQTFILQYCRDFLRDAWDMPELVSECSQMEPLLEEIMERNEYSIRELARVERLLTACEMKIMNLYARFPDSNFLSTMYSRSSSLKSMAGNIINSVE